MDPVWVSRTISCQSAKADRSARVNGLSMLGTTAVIQDRTETNKIGPSRQTARKCGEINEDHVDVLFLAKSRLNLVW